MFCTLAIAFAVTFAVSTTAELCGGYTSVECYTECAKRGHQSGSCTVDQCSCRSTQTIFPTNPDCGGYTSATCDVACRNDNYNQGICNGKKCTCQGRPQQICGGYSSAECTLHCLKDGYHQGECTLFSCSCRKITGSVISA